MRKTAIIVLVAYLLITVFFLRGVLLSPGMLAGGDWGLPFTSIQMEKYLTSGFYTWTDRELFGNQQFFLNSLPFQILTGLVSMAGVSGEFYAKTLLVAAFVFPAAAMYSFFRFLNCDKKIAFLGGFFYITLPFFFNYAAIGWLLVLFSMGILPISLIFFIKSVKEEKFSYSVIAGVLFFLSAVQSQSLVWYPLVFLSFMLFLANNKKNLLVYLRSIFVLLFVFLGLSAFWLLPFFLGEKSGVLNSGLGLSSVSLGTWVRLSNLNILKLWGSLFNAEYETSYLEIFKFSLFVFSFLAFSSLFFLKKNKIVYSFIVLFFVPIVLFKLGPNFVAGLPFSDLIRDMGRFSVISSFSCVVLATMVLNYMFQQKQFIKIIGVIFSILLVINTHSFWTGELCGEQKLEHDVRLKTYNFPIGDLALENKLKLEETDTKVLYLPIGSAVMVNDDQRFEGAFGGIRDIFASFSPKRGVIGVSDKGFGSATDLGLEITRIAEEQRLAVLTNVLNLIGAKYIVVRENISNSPIFLKKEMLNKNSGFNLLREWKTISLFENDNFLPHLYIPENVIYANGGVEKLLDVVGFDNSKNRIGVYLSDNTSSTTDNADNTLITRTKMADEVFLNFQEDKEKKIAQEADKYIKNKISTYQDVKNKPGTLMYEVAILKEKLEKERVKDDYKKLFEKYLFYANKRITEIEKYTDNTDKTQIARIVKMYEEDIGGMTKIIQEKKGSDYSWAKEQAERLATVIREHRIRADNAASVTNNADKSDNADRLRRTWRETEKSLVEFNEVFDFSKLEYDLEIPRAGEYEICLKTDAENCRRIKQEADENGDQSLVIGNLSLGEKVASESGELTYCAIGGRDFETGKQKFTIPAMAIGENLANKNGKIQDYVSEKFYRIGFDYQTEKKGTLIVTEGKLGEKIKLELPSTGKEFEHFEIFFKSSAEAEKGMVEVNTDDYENLTVEKIEIPEMILRNIKTAQDIKILNDSEILDDSKILASPSGKTDIKILSDSEKLGDKQMPRITFTKINPTKYKIKVEGAKEPYTLVFSESYHDGWKLYAKDVKDIGILRNSDINAKREINDGEKSVNEEIVASYFNGEIKEGRHQNIFLDKNTFETWGMNEVAKDNHLMVNGYANSWYIDTARICADIGADNADKSIENADGCMKNVDGSYNMELVVEFWPQRLFYVGLGISLTTLVVIVIALLFYKLRITRMTADNTDKQI